MTAYYFFTTDFRRRIVGFGHSLRNDRGALLLIPAVAVYAVVWSYITTLKFYALHATVFDLGLEMEELWKFVHPYGFTATTYLLTALDQPFQFLLSPISLPLNYPLLLVVQSLGLGSGAFAVYGISRSVLKNQTGAYCLSLAYLLYFPLGGVNWFDFHAQAFFIPLFLWAFFCYASRRYRLALILFMLAAGTTYSYVLLVVLFSGLTVFELVLRRVLFKQHSEGREWKFAVVLLAASVAFFSYQFVVYSYLIGISFALNANLVAGSIPILNRIDVLALLLIPMLFLPAFAPKWLVMLLPFSYLELTSAARPFNFPAIFQIQYTALAIPFVFIGAIYGIRTLNRFLARKVVSNNQQSQARQRLHRVIRRPTSTSGLAMTVLVVTVGFATVFQPYGPFNQCCSDNFEIANATDVNWTYFAQYTRLVSLIPTDTPYVLFQNSMPTVLPRPLEYSGAPLMTGLEDWVNVTASDAAGNQFPLELVQGRLANVPLNFAISDPNSKWYSIGGNVSMYHFFTTMYQSGFYGLVGEASGMTVLARGYNGSLEYYEPFSEAIPSKDLYTGGTTTLSTGPVLSRSNLTGQPAWSGPGFSLSPGTYRIGFSLMTSSAILQNYLSLLVLAGNTSTLLANQPLYGNDFTGPGVWTTFYLTVRLTTAYTDVQFTGWYAHWRGTISIRSISVTETAPPSSTYAGRAAPAPADPVADSG
ncbi:MAG: DUF2079 domain-containing protein [Thermoplasmata archaeon]